LAITDCAHAGLGIVNAIGSGGLGAAAALNLELCVEVEMCSEHDFVVDTPQGPLRVERSLLNAVASVASEKLGRRIDGICGRGRSSIPVAGGAKGSSALVNALLKALLEQGNIRTSLYELAMLGVEASRMAGVTVTGALDDHLAVSGCGAYATINPSHVARWSPDLDGVALLLVRGSRDIRSVDPESYTGLRGLFRRAWSLAVEGRWWDAAVLNGVAMMLSHGDPVDRLLRFLDEGAVAAGVSGKGPTLYLVYHSRRDARQAAAKVKKLVEGEPVVAELLHCEGPELPV
jgi:shikimate kinase